jgi:hypothetical protein
MDLANLRVVSLALLLGQSFPEPQCKAITDLN